MKKIVYLLLFVFIVHSQAYVITHSPLKDDSLTIKEVLKIDKFTGKCEKEIFDRFLMFNKKLDLKKDKETFNNYLLELDSNMTYKELKEKRDNLINYLNNEDLSNDLRIVFQGPTMPYFDMFFYSKFCYEQKEYLSGAIKVMFSIFGIGMIVFIGIFIFPSFVRKK